MIHWLFTLDIFLSHTILKILKIKFFWINFKYVVWNLILKKGMRTHSLNEVH